MGIGKKQGRDALTAIRAGTTREEARGEVADAVSILNEWISKRDKQDTKAKEDFAASQATQFATFVAALPEPTVDQTP